MNSRTTNSYSPSQIPAKSISVLAGLTSSIAGGLNYLLKNPIVGLYFVAQYQIALVQAGVPRNGLVAEYLFNNANALDSSGNGNDGDIFGAESVEDRCGNANSAMDFNGFAYIQGPADKYPTATRSISLWINPALHTYTPEIDRGISIFGYGGGGSADHSTSMIISLNNACMAPNTYSIQSHNNQNLAVWTDSKMFGSKSEWIHLVFTIDKHEGTEIYVNGDWKDSSPSFMKDTFVNGKNFVIGSCINPNGIGPFQDACVSNWMGMIDDIRVYDFKLSAAQIGDLLNEQCPTSSGIDWRLYTFPAIAAAACLATGIIGTKCHSNRKKLREDKLHEKEGGLGAIRGVMDIALPVAHPVAFSKTVSRDPEVADMDKNKFSYSRLKNSNDQTLVVNRDVELEQKSEREKLLKPMTSVSFGTNISPALAIGNATRSDEVFVIEEEKEVALPVSSNPSAMFSLPTNATSYPTQAQETRRTFGIQ